MAVCYCAIVLLNYNKGQMNNLPNQSTVLFSLSSLIDCVCNRLENPKLKSKFTETTHTTKKENQFSCVISDTVKIAGFNPRKLSHDDRKSVASICANALIVNDEMHLASVRTKNVDHNSLGYSAYSQFPSSETWLAIFSEARKELRINKKLEQQGASDDMLTAYELEQVHAFNNTREKLSRAKKKQLRERAFAYRIAIEFAFKADESRKRKSMRASARNFLASSLKSQLGHGHGQDKRSHEARYKQKTSQMNYLRIGFEEMAKSEKLGFISEQVKSELESIGLLQTKLESTRIF